MAKQTIDLGTTPNRGDGDPLRTAFRKINENFDELYAGDFAAPDQTASDLVPSIDATYDLGSAERQWADLYVSDFIYLNNARIEIDANGNLLVGGKELRNITDIQGSVFADDSTLLVDGVNGVIVGPMVAPNVFIEANIGGATMAAVNDVSIISGQSSTVLTAGLDVRIRSNGNDSLYNWNFNRDGTLELPGDIILNSGRINNSVSDGGGLQVEADTDFEIKVVSGGDTAIWSFEPNDGGRIQFPDGSTQTTAYTGVIPGYINTADLKTLVAASVDFNDFQSRIAAL